MYSYFRSINGYVPFNDTQGTTLSSNKIEVSIGETSYGPIARNAVNIACREEKILIDVSSPISRKKENPTGDL